MRLSVSLVSIFALSAAFSLAGPSFASPATASPAAATVFGQGAELHLMPLWGKQYGEHISNAARVGSAVRAVGLGFHPGHRVHLIYGVPNAEYVMRPIAQALVDAQGRFEARFKVTRSMGRNQLAQPLLVQAYEGASPGTGPQQAYAVSTLLVYGP